MQNLKKVAFNLQLQVLKKFFTMIYDCKFRGVWQKNCFYLNANYFGRWEFSKIFKIEIYLQLYVHCTSLLMVNTNIFVFVCQVFVHAAFL